MLTAWGLYPCACWKLHPGFAVVEDVCGVHVGDFFGGEEDFAARHDAITDAQIRPPDGAADEVEVFTTVFETQDICVGGFNADNGAEDAKGGADVVGGDLSPVEAIGVFPGGGGGGGGGGPGSAGRYWGRVDNGGGGRGG